jgi:hypothetical protein
VINRRAGRTQETGRTRKENFLVREWIFFFEVRTYIDIEHRGRNDLELTQQLNDKFHMRYIGRKFSSLSRNVREISC